MRPEYLIIAGLALNLVDVVTAKQGQGGILFGPTGWLRMIDEKLPHPTVPGTAIQLNLGGWLIVVGAGWWVVRKVT